MKNKTTFDRNCRFCLVRFLDDHYGARENNHTIHIKDVCVFNSRNKFQPYRTTFDLLMGVLTKKLLQGNPHSCALLVSFAVLDEDKQHIAGALTFKDSLHSALKPRHSRVAKIEAHTSCKTMEERSQRRDMSFLLQKSLNLCAFCLIESVPIS